MSFDQSVWQAKLDLLAADSRLRTKYCVQSPQGSRITVQDSVYLNFASNDYLGLANDDRVKQAARDAIEVYGVGSGASHMVVGHHHEHSLLEQELAAFTQRDRALLFSTGYMANLAVCAAFTGANSLILQDKLNHASLIDGARLSGARSQRFLHADSASLLSQLYRFTSKNKYDQVLVVTDGVFSMDGDAAPIGKLAEVAKHHGALLAVDDAHGLGVLGVHGAGCLEEQGVTQSDCDLLVGTFGKAFGTAGAFVAGPKILIDYLEQVARPHIYTTAFPPAIAAATRQSIQIVQHEPERRARLSRRIAYFRTLMETAGFEVLESHSAIQAVMVGANDSVMALAEYLRRKGMLVGAIRPPTVPPGSARLRVALSSEHDEQDISALVANLKAARQELKL